MKPLIPLLIVTLTLFSCRGNSNEEHKIYDATEVTRTIIKVSYEGHTYIRMDYAVLHDPDCKKCLDRFD